MRRCLALLVVAACGGEVAIDELDAAILDAVCSRYVRCGVIDSQDSCVTMLRFGDDGFVELQHAVANGTVRYDGGKMDDCIDAFASASCDDTVASARNDPRSCREALRGTIDDGGACMISEQCKSRRCDNPACPDACCEGTCAPTTAEARVGEACMPGAIDCVLGSFCNSARVCQALLGAGDLCQADAQCDYGLHCQTDIDRCVEAAHVGDACPDRSCADIGMVCDANAICAALPRRGDPCSLEVTSCQAPNICNRTTLICEAPPELGQPCTGSCGPGMFCDTAIAQCALRKAEGEPCARNSECETARCEATVCAAATYCL